MEEEQPLKVFSTVVTGEHFLEALKVKNVNYFLRIMPSKLAIKGFLISLGALLLVWIVANQIAWWAWIFIPIFIIFIIVTILVFIEVFQRIDIEKSIKEYASFLGKGKTMELKFFENYFHYIFEDTIFISRWEELRTLNIEENTITMMGEQSFYILKPSFTPEDFESIRKIFQEKVV
jgi:fatty acid desaturase